MLPKKNRADTKAIDQIFKQGRFISSPHLTFKFLKNGTALPQISFIAPKTVTKSAVKRNLLRRRGYRSLAPHLSNFPRGTVGAFIFGKQSLEFFGSIKKEEKNLAIENLQNEIESILKKVS